ncbi:Cell death-inducing p53-target protein 1 [Varanus komodoensis]|nr:Cell death-inducing p53-target protein 1 [Varanus komodoensis]
MQQMKKDASIPMDTFDPRQEPYAPGYSSSYSPEPYPLQPYPPQPWAPDPYLQMPPAPDPSAAMGTSGYDCPSPPPYSCEEVPCDRVGPTYSPDAPPVVVAGIFSSKPASTICPCCREIITTEVVYRVGALTFAASACMCMMGGCLGCFLIPFFTKCCKDVDHYCPCCQYHIYRYKRL